jgi:hypothetical protein
MELRKPDLKFSDDALGGLRDAEECLEGSKNDVADEKLLLCL